MGFENFFFDNFLVFGFEEGGVFGLWLWLVVFEDLLGVCIFVSFVRFGDLLFWVVLV